MMLLVIIPVSLVKSVRDRKRNGVWGRCADCEDMADPAFCEYFQRHDHKLTTKQLDEVVGYHARKAVEDILE